MGGRENREDGVIDGGLTIACWGMYTDGVVVVRSVRLGVWTEARNQGRYSDGLVGLDCLLRYVEGVGNVGYEVNGGNCVRDDKIKEDTAMDGWEHCPLW